MIDTIFKFFQTISDWTAHNGILLFGVGVVISAAIRAVQRRRRAKSQRWAALSQQRRGMALTASLPSHHEDPGEPLAVVMDVGLADGVVSVVATGDGDASLHLSDGRAVLDAKENFGIRNAAFGFLREAARHRAAFARTSKFLYPGPGRVRFYVRTGDGVYVMERGLNALANGEDELAGLLIAADELLDRLCSFGAR